MHIEQRDGVQAGIFIVDLSSKDMVICMKMDGLDGLDGRQKPIMEAPSDNPLV